jgi:transposase-like protein
MIYSNLLRIADHIKDDDICERYLIKMRWKGNITCVFCNHDKVYSLQGENKRFKCGKCRKHFSAIKGSIFENSPIPLRKWFMAMYLIATHKKGVSSVQLGSSIGVQQSTAWFMAHRIRYALKNKSFGKMLGVIQIDETYIGGNNKNKHVDKRIEKTQGRSLKDKALVLGVLHTGGNLHLKVIPDASSASIHSVIESKVSKGSIVISDEWKGYNKLTNDFSHVVIKHKEDEYVRGAFHNNGIEGVFSLLKRAIVGIFHWISDKHLQRYCDEFEQRYNNRHVPNEIRFDRSFNGINCRLTYKELTGKK